MHQKGNKIKRGSEQRKVHRDLTIITNDKNFSLFIYLFTYLLVRVTVKYSILPLFLCSLVFFVVSLYVFSNFLLFFFLFWLFYYCYFFFIFSVFVDPAPSSPHLVPRTQIPRFRNTNFAVFSGLVGDIFVINRQSRIM